MTHSRRPADGDTPLLPTIAELGRVMARLAEQQKRLEPADRVLPTAKQPAAQQQRNAVSDLLFKREIAIRDLIGTMPAQTLTDCAVQLGVANLLASGLDDGDDERANRASEIERITVSVIVVIIGAAGLDAAEYDLEQFEQLHEARFGATGPVTASDGRAA